MFSRVGSFYLRLPPETKARSTCPGARLALSLLLLLLALPALADQYAYQDRGDRREGIRAKPVSGDDIELVSVRAEPVGGASGAVPERMRLSFFLPANEPVNVTVRELDYRHYYWLDQVRPSRSWTPGETNDFLWPTRDVLRWLYDRGLQPADLGAVVRLGGSGAPALRERVAPAVLAAGEAPVALEGYGFTFKTNVPARLTCTLQRAGGKDTVWSKTFRGVSAGRPFTCRVPADRLAEGDYRLEVDGYSLDTNAGLKQVVRFFHSPKLR
jgi:hypothetical protein